jgi:2-amino-4-hydroxy-6-hydroxymethyldihydropteridine diphosphokinase
MTMTRNSSDAILIGLGSNVGDRLDWLKFGRRRIGALESTRVLRASSVYETEPVDGPPQGRYLNACLLVASALAPHDLLAALQAIEADAGRAREEPNAPRTLDLDVLLFGDRTITERGLVVPHPRFAQRAFALIPAADVAPQRRVPPGAETIATLRKRVSGAGIRPFCDDEGWR